MRNIDNVMEMIKEIDRMQEVYKTVESDRARECYSQYIDLVIEQADLTFEDKSNMREYWRRIIK